MLSISLFALTVFPAQLLPPFEPSILTALNQLRSDPSGYVGNLQRYRKYYHGDVVEIHGRPNLHTKEGVVPLDEAIHALESMHADLGQLVLSKGLSHAAGDHVADTGQRGLIGHKGADGSDLPKRIGRYGTWSGLIGEDIAYGERDSRAIILALLIDDGVPGRGHRKSLLDPRWHYVGIACGFHALYGTMCVLDFASGYRGR